MSDKSMQDLIAKAATLLEASVPTVVVPGVGTAAATGTEAAPPACRPGR